MRCRIVTASSVTTLLHTTMSTTRFALSVIAREHT